MPATLRETTLTYNGYTIGGAGKDITGFHARGMDRDRAHIRVTFVINAAASAAAFAAACLAAEAAFATPYKDLTIAMGGANLLIVTQSGNTGLDAMPRIEKRGQRGDSGRSCVYEVTIEFGLPATWNATYPGIRDATVALAYTPSRRAGVVFTGTMTAITTNDAKAQYDSVIAGYVTAQMTWLGITSYELVSEGPLAVSINRKTATFSRTYRELIFTQAGTTDDTGIVDQHLVVTRHRLGSENSPLGSAGTPGATSDQNNSSSGVIPLSEIEATWTASIDKTVTQDLRTKWDTVRDWVIAQVKATVGGTFGLMGDAPSFDFDENRITAVVRGVATDDGSGTIAYITETEYDTKEAVDFIPAWDGDPDTNFEYEAVRIRLRKTTSRKRSVGGGGGGGSGGGGSGGTGGVGLFGGSDNAGSFFGIGGPGFQIQFGTGYAVGGPSNDDFFDIDLRGSSGGGGGGTQVDNGGSQFGIDGAGGGGGSGRWRTIHTRKGTRPLQIGRPPFSISLAETWDEKIERYSKPVTGGGGSSGGAITGGGGGGGGGDTVATPGAAG